MEPSDKQIEAAAKELDPYDWDSLEKWKQAVLKENARRALTAAFAQSPEDGAVGVKPFDLAILLKHAFFSGFECASSYGDPAHHWVDYDPEGRPEYQRIRSALTPAQHQTHVARQEYADFAESLNSITDRDIEDSQIRRSIREASERAEAQEAGAEPVAYMVCDAMIPHQPVKAKGWSNEPFPAFYPAERENDAREAARILRAEFTPLYAYPIPSDSKSVGMGWSKAHGLAKQGFVSWAAKPHNTKWVRKIDGTPVENDLLVKIAEAFASHPLCASPPLDRGRWRPIDSAPKNGTRFLGYWNGTIIVAYWLDNSARHVPWAGWKPEGMHALRGKPTHWRPLPPAPTPEDGA